MHASRQKSACPLRWKDAIFLAASFTYLSISSRPAVFCGTGLRFLTEKPILLVSLRAPEGPYHTPKTFHMQPATMREIHMSEWKPDLSGLPRMIPSSCTLYLSSSRHGLLGLLLSCLRWAPPAARRASQPYTVLRTNPIASAIRSRESPSYDGWRPAGSPLLWGFVPRPASPAG